LLPDARRSVFLAFSRLATVCVGVLLLAGVYLSILRLPRLSDLWTSGYGQVLLIKIGLVVFALAWGGLHRLIAVPAAERGGLLPTWWCTPPPRCRSRRRASRSGP